MVMVTGGRLSRRARGAGDGETYRLETLEQRVLLAVDFASVGLSYTLGSGSTTAAVYASEGRIGDSGATRNVSGSLFVAGNNGRAFDGELPYSRVVPFGDGRFLRDPDRGRWGKPAETNGAQFLRGDGFSAGWWIGQYGSNSEELEIAVEARRNVTNAQLSGNWRFSLTGIDYSFGNFFSASGLMTINSTGRIEWLPDTGDVSRSTSFITGLPGSSGTGIRTNFGEYFYLSADGSTLIFADMDRGDGEVFMGMAVRVDADAPVQNVAGGYHVAWALTNRPAEDIRGQRIAFEQRYLELLPNGDYRIYDLDAWDDGRRDVIARGFWSLSGGVVRLQSDRGEVVNRLVVAADGKSLMGVTRTIDAGRDATLWVATRNPADGQPPPDQTISPPVFSEGAVRNGRAVVYERRADGSWYVSDVAALTGSPDVIPGSLVTWTDPKDGLTHAAGRSAAGLLLFRQSATGDWTVRNLTAEIGNAAAVARELNVMVGPDGYVSLVGLNPAGDLLRYFQTGATREVPGAAPQREAVWAFANIAEQDLRPTGQQMPSLVGDTVAYATAWGGLNIAGLDSDGRVWSVWWAPGLPNWNATDITSTVNAAPLTGGLTVYLTPWGGINIGGLDTRGHFVVSWWVPGFDGEWRFSDLTAETGGPLLTGTSLASYVSSWGGLNIAGTDAQSGQTVVYWWAPARTQEGWAITSLTTAVQPPPPPITTGLRGVAAPDNSLNVLGYSPAGAFIRYYWEPSFGGQWLAQDVSAVAIPVT